MAVRPGTGAIAKFFKKDGEPTAAILAELKELTDRDVEQLAAGIQDGTLTY